MEVVTTGRATVQKFLTYDFDAKVGPVAAQYTQGHACSRTAFDSGPGRSLPNGLVGVRISHTGPTEKEAMVSPVAARKIVRRQS